MSEMKIAIAASELAPVAQTGGLGDAVAGLTAQLHKNGHEVCLILPYYQAVRKYHYWKEKETGISIDIQLGHRHRTAEILEYRKRGSYQIFFIKNDELFDRAGLYADQYGTFGDNAERFIFFSKAVVELCRRMEPKPDIIHANDWQTALVPVLVKAHNLPFRTLLTIHNMAYQGQFWSLDFTMTNLSAEWFAAGGLEYFGDINLLKGGILAADSLSTVSDAYARDILTPESGYGLDGVLREQRGKLHGFQIGVDYKVWNPETDKALAKNYSATSPKGKATCRDDLLAKLKLAAKPKGPVFMMASRLHEEKGFDIMLPLIDRLLADDVRLIVLGAGDAHYMAGLTVAARKHPQRFVYLPETDTKMTQLILAGADLSIIPSRMEPAGHSAVRSLRYGTIPVARDTGGLHELIRDYDPTTKEGWGILFYEYSQEALLDALMRARDLFADSGNWRELVKSAMRRNFSWENSAAAYESVYNGLLKS